ncbi:flagellar protein FlaF [Azospirillum brasilense]|uniref:Flagellar protein FlaF n=1 Tax=Azospirillum brasilense TaxID=192 RepID=A0A560AHJ2_AZOBR|nr:flagellar biosynthesis regulator FlaF [Azospirillum brasilense]TWA59806.1 flagellar protein FlaF [Azospirillum brasilense]
MSIAAYKQTMAECEDPRRIEYLVFLRITLAIEEHREAGWRSDALKSALWRNLELWNILRADLVDDDNALPEGLRAGLISLSFSVERQTRMVLRGEADAGVLIDINRSVMRGLQGVAQAEAPVAMEAAYGA